MSLSFAKLSDICDIGTGKKDANHGDSGGPYPFYTCAMLPIKSPTKSFHAPAIILPGNGANVGQVLSCKEPFEAYQRTYVLNNFRNVDFSFIKFYFEAHWAKHVLSDQYGSATNYLRMRNFTEFRIPLPPLSEQKRIASILDKADALRTMRKQAIAKLDELLQSVFLEMFGDPVTNPKGWEMKTLGDVSDFVSGSTISGAEEFIGQQHGYLAMKVSDMNTKGNEYNINSTALWVSKPKIKSALCQKGAIVMPKRGGAIGTNKKRVITRETVLDPNLMGVLGNHDMVSTAYLFWWFQKFDLTDISSGSSVPQLNKKDLAPLKICVPPKEFQSNFGKFCSKTSAFRTFLESNAVKVDTLFASLQHRAFKGEL